MSNQYFLFSSLDFSIKSLSRYYDFFNINNCNDLNLNREILSNFSTERFRKDDICNERIYNEAKATIIYDTTNYFECSIDLSVKINQNKNGMKSLTFRIMIIDIFANQIKINKYWKRYIKKSFKFVNSYYVGAHIRTLGFYNDFVDYIGTSKLKKAILSFDYKVVENELLKMYYKYNTLLYLASDSKTLKEMVEDVFKREKLKFETNRAKIIHSSTSNKTINKETVIDMEILSSGYSLILSHSTFSKSIYYKNKNCIYKRCKFINPFKEALY